MIMRKWITTVSLLVTASVWGQALPPGVTPQMVQQVQSMSPAQQQALAKQYGINLPGQAAAPSEAASALGEQGESLTQAEQVELDAEVTNAESTRAGGGGSARYGLSLFDSKVSTFAPTDDAPVPESYRLGIGDQLIVQLFGKENAQYTLQVGRNGDVSFPKLGSINLMGLTFEDARELLKTRVAQQLIGVEVVVSMGRLRAIGIFMAGEVKVPGAYSVSALTTVTQALFQSGGVTGIGSLRNIEVRRGGEVVSVFDTYDLLMRGDATNDIRLQSGDVIFVPPYQGVVEITGEVKRPRIYELKGSETLADVIAMSGSYRTRAYPGLAVLVRKATGTALPTAVSVNLLDQRTLDMPVRDGDILRVPASGDTLTNTVTLEGAVYRGGTFGWYEGMRVSDLVKNPVTDLLPEADLSYTLIVSVKNELLDIELNQFRLIDAIVAPGSNQDPVLKQYDTVLVFSLPDLDGAGATGSNTRARLLSPVLAKLRAQAREDEPVQVVSVSGAVRSPGTYPLFAGTTIADLVRAAGGLKDSAYLQSAELRTLREDKGGALLATYKEIPLARELSPTTSTVLQSRDHLTVREIPDWSPQDSIDIRGEVAFPGTYLIQKGERLSDVIARAGGFTEEAFPEGAIFTREEVARKEADRARKFAADIRQTFATRLLTEETVGSNLGEVAQITAALESFEGQGRLLVDLPAALAGDTLADVEVADGDALVIPKRNRSVTIVGEVQQPGSHVFQAQYSLQDYLSLSAGLSTRADDKAMYIVRANGKVQTLETSWWRFSGASNQIQPGDTIVVPVNTQYKERLASWREITQIVYQSLVSVAAVASL
jgi:polysaccharide export outer membrane protein